MDGCKVCAVVLPATRSRAEIEAKDPQFDPRNRNPV